ncbi:cupin domain-containing protein [Actibacterium pelagium]|uniref:Cupin n=1 Tax=Actibacterium pelagium TaxID=2029103 RepID=A0A917AKU7_9RHOB|nr:cupin domain-containing protein [Actibacterium pelagium]GGE59555.1 cupin [Actibacterium pelagium]
MSGRTKAELENVTYACHLRGSETGGSIGIFESTDAPGYGPPRHIHHDADETFFILSGEVDFLCDGQVVERSVGQTLFVPRGTEHCFRVKGEYPARLLTIMTPGGFEEFFDAFKAKGLELPRDMEQIAKIALEFHCEFTGPPMEAA